MENLFDLLFMLLPFCVGAGISFLMSISDGINPYIFSSKDGKDAVYERKNGRRGVYFLPVGIFPLQII